MPYKIKLIVNARYIALPEAKWIAHNRKVRVVDGNNIEALPDDLPGRYALIIDQFNPTPANVRNLFQWLSFWVNEDVKGRPLVIITMHPRRRVEDIKCLIRCATGSKKI